VISWHNCKFRPGTDSDWIVKVIDAFPSDEPETAEIAPYFKNEQLPHDGAEAMRGRL
jgi:hypothetical protein